MKKILFLLLITIIACSNSDDPKEDTKGTPTPVETNPANIAINAFSNAFYTQSFGVYYATTAREKRAAIWTQAMYWDMLMNAYKRTEDPKYLTALDDFFVGMKKQYDNFNWHNGTEWFIYDDIMWWVISLARGYEMTKNNTYLTLSESGFERVWDGSPVVGDNGSYDEVGGGMYWRWPNDNPSGTDIGKMACINYPTVIAAMTLYNATKKTGYLNKAKDVYSWARNNIFDLNDGKVADSRHGNGTPNWKTHLYNQATCIGAAVMLYKETKEEHYKQDAILAANYVRQSMSNSNGILNVEYGIEQGVYTAIFAQYIIRLIEDCNQTQYLEWMQYNMEKGWENRDTRNLTYKDFTLKCPGGLLEVYDASACPALMQVIPAKK